jgi:hypothetical protein
MSIWTGGWQMHPCECHSNMSIYFYFPFIKRDALQIIHVFLEANIVVHDAREGINLLAHVIMDNVGQDIFARLAIFVAEIDSPCKIYIELIRSHLVHIIYFNLI